MTGFASKAAEPAAPIAGVLTAIENLKATEVIAQTTEHATWVASWDVSEAERLLDAEDADPVLGKPQILLAWLHTKQGCAPFDKRRIVRH
jgi:hypothetical protein